jgi:hypothetical protein
MTDRNGNGKYHSNHRDGNLTAFSPHRSTPIHRKAAFPVHNIFN